MSYVPFMATIEANVRKYGERQAYKVYREGDGRPSLGTNFGSISDG